MKENIKTVFGSLSVIILTLMPFAVFSGCQKVINVDLNVAAPRIVIEGVVNDKRGPYTVTISRSGSYFNQPVLQTVSGATVIISDNAGTTDSLNETEPGIYLTSLLRGFPGRTYTLTVLSDNQVYSGSSTILSHVDIDSLKLVKSLSDRFDFGGGNKETNADIHCFFKDPREKNFYRIKVYKNDSINTESYRLYDDQYTNGEETELRVANAEAGATYRIELMSIDKPTYGYYRTLEELLFTNPFFGSTPANPNTNLSNGALGYFGAYATSSRMIVITDSLLKSVE